MSDGGIFLHISSYSSFFVRPLIPSIMTTADQTLVISMFVVSWTHGVFTVLFALAVYLIWFKKKFNTQKQCRVGLGLLIFMYTISSIHFCMSLAQGIWFLGSSKGGDNRVHRFTIIAAVQGTIAGVNCLFADLLLIWRAWVICGKDNRVIVFPVICLVGLAVTTCGFFFTAFSSLNLVTGSDLQTYYRWARSPPARIWSILLIAFSCATNLSMTSVIAFKLIRHQRFMRRTLGYSRAWMESLIVIESGALYTLAFIISLILYVANQDAQAIMLEVVTQLAGIIPTLILVAISAGLTSVDIPTINLPSNGYATPALKFRSNVQNPADNTSMVSHEMTFATSVDPTSTINRDSQDLEKDLGMSLP